MKIRIGLGADHAGYALKEAVKRHLIVAGHEVRDFGTFSTDSVDFPLIASKVARAVAGGAVDRGVLVDGAGSPSALVANKFPGIRAGVVTDVWTARISREHADANCIALGAKVVTIEAAGEILDVWLSTDFLGGKYQKRIDQISAIEKEILASAHPARRIVTAADIERARREGKEIVLGEDAVVTPLARERMTSPLPQRKGMGAARRRV